MQTKLQSDFFFIIPRSLFTFLERTLALRFSNLKNCIRFKIETQYLFVVYFEMCRIKININ